MEQLTTEVFAGLFLPWLMGFISPEIVKSMSWLKAHRYRKLIMPGIAFVGALFSAVATGETGTVVASVETGLTALLGFVAATLTYWVSKDNHEAKGK